MRDRPPPRHFVRHPAADDLRRYADGALDPVRDEALVAHVDGCAECLTEVERLRRAAAALSLASRPPDDLLQRIQARRLANECVTLPVPDDETDDEAHWAPRSDAERHADAVLALSSRPPEDLLAGITARRASGERVLLPAVPDGPRRRSWRWLAAPVGVAALALLTVRVVDSTRRTPRSSPVVERVASTSPVSTPPVTPRATPTPSVPRATTTPSSPPGAFRGVSIAPDPATPHDSAAAVTHTPAAAEGAASVAFRESAGALAVALAYAATLDSAQTRALDSVARVVRDDPACRVDIRYTDPSFRRESDSWRLLQLARERLLLGGVAEEQVRAVRVPAVNAAGLRGRSDAIEVVVRTPR